VPENQGMGNRVQGTGDSQEGQESAVRRQESGVGSPKPRLDLVGHFVPGARQRPQAIFDENELSRNSRGSHHRLCAKVPL
jgi:hypothetical protein